MGENDLVITLLLRLAETAPDDDDVVAGPWGALIFVLLIVGTALLLWSFTRQIKKTNANAEAGVFDQRAAEADSGSDSESNSGS